MQRIIQSLLIPRRETKHSSQRPLTQRLAAVDRLEKQDLLLEVRGEIRHLQDLSEPRPRQPELPCSVGLILNLSAKDAQADFVGESECDGDARGMVHRALRQDGDESLSSSVPDPMKLAVHDPHTPRTHASASWGTSSGGAESPLPRPTMNTLTRLAGSSTSTDWTTARSSRPRF